MIENGCKLIDSFERNLKIQFIGDNQECFY